MMLARIERGPAGADLLTFECPKCERVYKTRRIEGEVTPGK
jgi:hypothetical protein